MGRQVGDDSAEWTHQYLSAGFLEAVDKQVGRRGIPLSCCWFVTWIAVFPVLKTRRRASKLANGRASEAAKWRDEAPEQGRESRKKTRRPDGFDEGRVESGDAAWSRSRDKSAQ